MPDRLQKIVILSKAKGLLFVWVGNSFHDPGMPGD